MISDILNGKQDASRKAIRLMRSAITRIPAKRFKDHEYTQQIFDAIESYLSSGDQLIRKIARKQKTDRLEVSKTIACDCLEYFSFLPMQLEPMQLEKNPEFVHNYIATMDNIFMLLRKIEHRKSQIKQLKAQLAELN